MDRRPLQTTTTALLLCLVLGLTTPWKTEAFTPLTTRHDAVCRPKTTSSSSSLPAAADPSFLEVVGTIGPLVVPNVVRDMATGGALSVAGDVIAQTLTNKDGGGGSAPGSLPPRDWDAVRTTAMGAFGALYTGGAQHYIFGFINEQLTDPVQRLAVAQFCFIPLLYYPTYLLLVPTLRSLSADDPDAERARLRQQVLGRLPATLMRNWGFWLPVQFVQFSFVPDDMHVTYCAAFGVVWNAILSWSTMQQGTVPSMPSSTATTTSEEVSAASSRRGTSQKTPVSVGSDSY